MSSKPRGEEVFGSKPTEADYAELGPELVRKGPKGGYFWLCEVPGCRQAANYLSAAGKKICRSHGGATPRQLDPIARAEAAAAGEPVPRPPGRPIKHGFYSTAPQLNVDTLVADYRERQLNPDLTDDDMYYLRAYIEEMKPLVPDVVNLHAAIKGLPAIIENWLEKAGVGDVLDELGLLKGVYAGIKQIHELMREMRDFWKDQEERHERLVQLGKVRAETRLKDAAAAQMDVFSTMLDGLQLILSEMLSASSMEALQARLEKEFSTITVKAVKVTSEDQI